MYSIHVVLRVGWKLPSLASKPVVVSMNDHRARCICILPEIVHCYHKEAYYTVVGCHPFYIIPANTRH